MPMFNRDELPEDPWLTGQNTQVPTDPAAQVDPTPNPWMDPAATATPPAQTTPPAASTTPSYVPNLGQTGAGLYGNNPDDGGAAGWTAGQPSAPPAAEQSPYRSLMDAVNNATDPTSQSVARDALARRVQTDLEGDGHKVSWKGDQLIVDGRAYELGGTLASGPADSRSMTPPAQGGTGNLADDYRTATQGLKANERDQVTLAEVARRLTAMGYDATIAETDPQGRNQGLIINGVLHRVIDSSDNWTFVSNANGDAWGAEGGSALTPSPFANGGGELPPWLTNPEADPDLMGLSGSIPGFDEIYKRLAADNPEEQATSALVRKILENPESLDDRTVEMMKARNAEEVAAGQRSQDEDLQRFGFSAGLDMSPWLAGQRAEGAWNARNAIVSGNRAVDMEAAETRTKDRQSAVQIGQGWSEYRKGKSVQAINTAVETVGAKGDLARAAKSLGLSKSQLMISYIGQNLNYDISLKALQQKGEQFATDLAQRISEMKQRSDEFEAQFGLDLNRFQLDKDRFAWDRAKSTFQ